ncbi:hypothetical protein Sthe_3277 [Sphaerobacter thermophilus DSM 20745]|uniref:Uncharacterized protein n=1 Tax=Sphaerobacter thermophilus (strain ATCC 49802 / DSM 20745 / KCCM 41009 / NCIMB 13125 / S 6022) TaxID=479434 RepID=D1CA34_SPHTD|nr:hypothetical protein Sthe_3277 [Sphaerobacter thermophilus DSM 20745]
MSHASCVIRHVSPEILPSPEVGTGVGGEGYRAPTSKFNGGHVGRR